MPTQPITGQQNKSLHLFFRLLADELNGAGFSVMETLRHDAEIPWTEELVKALMWKPIQNAMYDKTSTQRLTTTQTQEVYETLNRHLAEKIGVHVPWPQWEERP